VLESAEDALAGELLELVVEKVHRCTDDAVGFDAQAADW